MYKVTLYERIKYPNEGQVLLDTSSGDNLGVTEAKLEVTLNEAGSFTFSIVPTHPLYDYIEPLYTFVKVEEDGTEIFYGRVLMEKTNRITGIKQVTCEGALAFLLDIEMGEDDDETSYTAGGYFQYCLDVYNQRIREDDYLNQDLARELHLGNVTIPEAMASDDYKNGSRTQVQSVMKSKLLNVYDGFFTIRPSGTKHYLDWVSQVGITNPQPIRIKRNVVTNTTTKSGEDIFTLLWPKGNTTSSDDDDDDDDSSSSSSSVEISPMPLSVDMVKKYGIIIRTVNFDADDTTTLYNKAQEHINKIQDRLSQSGEVNFVDMSYLDGTYPKVHLGDVFTHIDGLEDTKVTASSLSRDLLNPKNDKLTLKTDKDLMSSSGSNGTNSSSSSSSSGSSSSLSGTGSKWYKFIHETETDLSLAAKNIEITAEEKIKVVAQQVETQASQISTLSTNMGTVQGKWTAFEGTAMYQNKDSIATVAGKFRTDNYGRLILDEGTQLVVSGDGTSTNVGRLVYLEDNTVRDVGQIVAIYQGSYSYQHDNEIAGIVGRYEVETYVDPQNPWKKVTPASDANPKELGYYEKTSNDQWVKTNDTEVVPNKDYYIPNDIKKVTFDSGGGYKIKENGVEYGVYTKVGDSTELTGGIIVDKLNDGSTTTKIKGSRVIIGDTLTDDDLSSWAVSAKNGTGVFAKYLTVKELTAQQLNTLLANIGDADIDSLTTENDIHVGGEVDATRVSADDVHVSDGGSLSIGEAFLNIVDISFPATNTLRVHYVDGTTQDFSKATTLSGEWSGGNTWTVTASPQGNEDVIRIGNKDRNTIGIARIGAETWLGTFEHGQYDAGFDAVVDPYFEKWTTTDVETDLVSNTIWFQTSKKSNNTTVRHGSRSVYLTGGSSWTGSTSRVYLRDSSISGSVVGMLTVTAPTETQTITQNGTYTPSSGTVGFSSVVVNVQTGTALNGQWNAGTLTVNASPQGVSETFGLMDNTSSRTSWSADKKTATLSVYAVTGNSETAVDTGKRLTVDTTDAYNQGYYDTKVTYTLDTSLKLIRVTKSLINGSGGQLNVTIGAGIAYDATTHKYTANAYGLGNKLDSVESGTEAYDAGSTSGYQDAKTYYEPDNITINTSAKTITVLNAAGDSVGGPYSVSSVYDAGFADVKGTYTTTNGVLQVSKSTTGSTFPLSFSIDADITYNSSTHKYTAKALCDETVMDSVVSGTEAYVDGQNSVTPKVYFNASYNVDGSTIPAVLPTITGGSNFLQIGLNVGSVSSQDASGQRTVRATVGSSNAVSQIITDYGDGYSVAKTEYEPDSITVNTSAKTVTVLNSAGDTVGGPYSVSSVYNAGFNAVSSPTFSSWRSSSSTEPSSDIISNTVTFSVDDTTSGTARTGTRQVNLTQASSWSSGSKQVFLRDAGTSGDYIGKITVSMPSSASWSSSINTETYQSYNVYCTVGGKQYGAHVLGTATSWNHGGQTANLSYSRVNTLSGQYSLVDMATYGQGYNYVRVQAAYVNASGSRTTNSNYSVTISGTTYYGMMYLKVPQYQDKTVTSNGTVYPDSGYAGLSSVTVNVSTTDPHTFWGYVGLYQSSITVEGETYSLYLYSESRKSNATTRVYK